MNPRHYVDFIVADIEGGEQAVKAPRAALLPTPVLAGAALKVLHRAFREEPGHYALALPGHARQPFAVLRVFAEGRDQLDKLVDVVEPQPIMRDYLRLGYPRKVPVDFSGTWTEYRRYRIPARRSGRKPNDNLRERRMAWAADHRLPFFIMQSRSTGQQFGLYVSIQTDAQASPEVHPDSYGLSVASRPFALPDLP